MLCSPGRLRQRLASVLTSDARDGDKIRAAMAILDRAGVGPRSSQDLSVGLSLVEQWMAELEALGESSDLDSVRRSDPGF